MKPILSQIRVGLVLLSLILSGCSKQPQPAPTGPDQGPTTKAQADPQTVLAQLEGKVLSTGPNGEAAEPASAVSLTESELDKIKSTHATAAIVLHYSGNDWSNAQVNGLKTQFAAMGIDVIAVTDAGFKPERQVSDIETVLAKKPSIIVSIPTDPVATAGAYKEAADRGVKLVFMDNVPKGLIAGKDYVSVVSADNYGNGAAAAALMAKALAGHGNIGIIYYSADFFVTRERYDGFKKTVTDNFPNLKIIAEQGIGGPDFSGDGEKAASAMITSHRNLDGIWVVWDVPAEGVIAAARTAGRSKLVITTCDLGENVAIDMARGGFVKGLGAQRPFDQGVTEALLAGYGLLGKKAPAYVALPSLPATKDNLLESWRAVYHQDPPADVKSSMK
ncbi:MAG: substrate-binding domain-containing protein [Verrucomicrobiota bacterium]